MTTLRLELAQEEAANLAIQELPSQKSSPSTFLQVGLDLEEQQYVFNFDGTCVSRLTLFSTQDES